MTKLLAPLVKKPRKMADSLKILTASTLRSSEGSRPFLQRRFETDKAKRSGGKKMADEGKCESVRANVF